jgi:predicted Rossmann fold flavoprotein
MHQSDVIVIGAGAAGLMCAQAAGQRGRSVIILEHTDKIGEKIRISGGGRCNFTNLHCGPQNFLSNNPHFCKSALKRYSPRDFIAMVEAAGIEYHEKTVHPNATGQLFCDSSSQQIIDMLQGACLSADVKFHLETNIISTLKTNNGFHLKSENGKEYQCQSLVIASGGLSIPKIGATHFGYKIAEQFGLKIVPPRAALVPLTFDPEMLERTRALSGVAVDAVVKSGDGAFQEGLLFTHRGLSGPSILQISSYWEPGKTIEVDLKPGEAILETLKTARKTQAKQMLRTVLADHLPQRLAQMIAEISGHDERIADLSDEKLRHVAAIIHNWVIMPSGSEGYRTAEVTLGGVDTDAISSKTFETTTVPGLYFIGEVLDVTGHLGGHNFQWAWSSGWCAGQAV